jgi:hypothetical protein
MLSEAFQTTISSIEFLSFFSWEEQRQMSVSYFNDFDGFIRTIQQLYRGCSSYTFTTEF